MAEEFGPVQIMVVGFPGTTFHGEVLPELQRLRDADLVRVIDLVVVAKDENDEIIGVELSDLSPEESAGARGDRRARSSVWAPKARKASSPVPKPARWPRRTGSWATRPCGRSPTRSRGNDRGLRARSSTGGRSPPRGDQARGRHSARRQLDSIQTISSYWRSGGGCGGCGGERRIARHRRDHGSLTRYTTAGAWHERGTSFGWRAPTNRAQGRGAGMAKGKKGAKSPKGAKASRLETKELREPVGERMAAGKALRERVPREAHGEWTPDPDRPVSDLAARGAGDEPCARPDPHRHGRMKSSPFAFLRGSAIVMAEDLAGSPTTGLTVPGVRRRAPDELRNLRHARTATSCSTSTTSTRRSPVHGSGTQRLAASFVVAGRHRNFSAAQTRLATIALLRSYALRMREFASMRHIDVWYSHIDVDTILAAAPPQVRSASRPACRRPGCGTTSTPSRR